MWHLSDSCSYIESTGWELLHTADAGREDWLYGAYRMGKQAIDAGGNTAYVIPSDQPDFPTATKMVNVLRQADIEVEQAQTGVQGRRQVLPGGQLHRPRGAAVPGRRGRPDQPADLPRPAQPRRHAGAARTTWPAGRCRTRWASRSTRSTQAIIANTKPVDTGARAGLQRAAAAPGYAYALDPRVNDSYTAAMSAAEGGRDGHPHDRAPCTTDQGTWPAGTFLVTPRAGADQRIKAQAKQLGLTVASVATMPAGDGAAHAPAGRALPRLARQLRRGLDPLRASTRSRSRTSSCTTPTCAPAT